MRLAVTLARGFAWLRDQCCIRWLAREAAAAEARLLGGSLATEAVRVRHVAWLAAQQLQLPEGDPVAAHAHGQPLARPRVIALSIGVAPLGSVARPAHERAAVHAHRKRVVSVASRRRTAHVLPRALGPSRGAGVGARVGAWGGMAANVDEDIPHHQARPRRLALNRSEHHVAMLDATRQPASTASAGRMLVVREAREAWATRDKAGGPEGGSSGETEHDGDEAVGWWARERGGQVGTTTAGRGQAMD